MNKILNYKLIGIGEFSHEPEKRFGKDININQKLKELYDEIKKHKLNILYVLMKHQ